MVVDDTRVRLMARPIVEAVGDLGVSSSADPEIEAEHGSRMFLEAQELHDGGRWEQRGGVGNAVRHQDGAGERRAGDAVDPMLDPPFAEVDRGNGVDEIVMRAGGEQQASAGHNA